MEINLLRGVYFVLILNCSFKFHNISVQQIKFDLASAAHTFADGTDETMSL